jgi:uncharacterized membrane protein YdjX (TVP38/TMEM64 family)
LEDIILRPIVFIIDYWKLIMEKKRNSIFQILILVCSLVLILALIWIVFGETLSGLFHLLMRGDAQEIEHFLEQEGQWKGILSTIILAILQVVSIFLPGFAIQIAAGVIYGWWKAFLICYTGYVLGNFLVFVIARRLGTHAAAIISGQGKKRKKANLLTEKMKDTRPSLVVAVTTLLPVVPNGIIPYIASTSSIRRIRYMEAVMSTAWVQIFINCLAGNFLISGHYFFMAIAITFQIILMVIVAVKGNAIMDMILKGPLHKGKG